MKKKKTRDRILEYVQHYIEVNGYSPTVREIGKAVDLKSSSTVHTHLNNLIKAGLITKQATLPRTFRIAERIVLLEVKDNVPVLIEWNGSKYKLVENNK